MMELKSLDQTLLFWKTLLYQQLNNFEFTINSSLQYNLLTIYLLSTIPILVNYILKKLYNKLFAKIVYKYKFIPEKIQK